MKTWAVIVAYHPRPAQLQHLAGVLSADGVPVVVVDNTPAGERREFALPEGASWLALGRNTGIAYAQNAGIAHARAHGAEAIAFFDQDSEPCAGLVATLAATLDPGRPGVAAPTVLDRARGFEYPSFRLNRWRWPRAIFAPPSDGPQLVDLAISSGSVATTATFDVVGAMDEDFFIDYVDLEWCLRCRARGVPIHLVPGVRIQHSIGMESVDVGPLTVFVHGSARSYYRLRNAFLLLRRSHVPLVWALHEIAAALVHHLLVLPRVPSRGEHLRVLRAGIADGLRGITGPRPYP